LYGSEDAARQAFDNAGAMEAGGETGQAGKNSAYMVYYLGRLEAPGNNERLVRLVLENGPAAFGVLAGAAVRLYYEGGYKHLFQMRCKGAFSGQPVEDKGTMFELLWLCAPLPPEHKDHRYTPCDDCLLVENFKENINKCPQKKKKRSACSSPTSIPCRSPTWTATAQNRKI
jgi:hypothetical protein